MVGYVNPATGVGVVEPGAAHVGVLFQHHHVDTHLAQPMGHEQARHAGANHSHGKGGARGEVVELPGWCPPVAAVGRQFLTQQSEVLVHVGLTHRPSHELAQGGVVEWRGVGVAGVAVGDQGGQRHLAGLVHLGSGEAGLGVHDVVGIGLQVGPQYRQVTGELGYRWQQGTDGGLTERSGDGGIVSGDGGGAWWQRHARDCCMSPAGPDMTPVGSVWVGGDTM